MDACKYHPLVAATYRCEKCESLRCNQCIDDSSLKGQKKCIVCQTELLSLGAANSATPFWRRLRESFHYPLNAQTLVFITIISFLSSVVNYLPLSFILTLAISGAFFKYCFGCLEKTAHGSLQPPDVTEAYDGGLSLMLQLMAIMLVMVASVVGAAIYIGSGFAGLLGVLYVVALPAVLISFAMTGSLAHALNPMVAVRLIGAVGLPYGLLLAFIMIMMSSVGVIGQLLSGYQTIVTITLEAMVANYYMVVAFHLMGYMIFQFQRELDFVAEQQGDDADLERDPRDQLLAKIDVFVKEGDYAQALKLFSAGIKSYPDDKEIFSRCFDFLCATNNSSNIGDFSNRYLKHLLQINRHDQLRAAYKRALLIDVKYVPDTAMLRYQLAKACHDSGDLMTCVKLINGLHKQFPSFAKLIDAYQLMLDAMGHLPKLAAQIPSCEKLIAQLKRQAEAAQVEAQQRAQQVKDSKVKTPIKRRRAERIERVEPKNPFLTDEELGLVPPSDGADTKQPELAEDGSLPPIEFK